MCIKLYHKASSLYIEDFARQLTALQALTHSYILPIIDFGIDQEGVPFIVVPYCSGGDLRRILGGRSYLPLTEALPLLQQIGAALDYAHSLLSKLAS